MLLLVLLLLLLLLLLLFLLLFLLLMLLLLLLSSSLLLFTFSVLCRVEARLFCTEKHTLPLVVNPVLPLSTLLAASTTPAVQA